MKKIITLLLLTLFFLLTGCQNLRIKESGDFKYHLFYDKAYIYELTESGKEKEIIILPTALGNYNTGIGYRKGMLRTVDFTCISDKLKTIYFNAEIIQNTYGDDAIHFKNGKKDGITLFFPYIPQRFDNFISYEYNLYFSNEYSREYMDLYKDFNVQIANVSYNYNYDKEGYKTYFIDDIDGALIENIPSNPHREGYEFDGWYKEAECINKWDFENEMIPNKEYDKDGNYIYKEIMLYAKWK